MDNIQTRVRRECEDAKKQARDYQAFREHPGPEPKRNRFMPRVLGVQKGC